MDDQIVDAQGGTAVQLPNKGGERLARRLRIRGGEVDQVGVVGGDRNPRCLPPPGLEGLDLRRSRCLGLPLPLVGGENLQRLAVYLGQAVKGQGDAAADRHVGSESGHVLLLQFWKRGQLFV